MLYLQGTCRACIFFNFQILTLFFFLFSIHEQLSNYLVLLSSSPESPAALAILEHGSSKIENVVRGLVEGKAVGNEIEGEASVMDEEESEVEKWGSPVATPGPCVISNVDNWDDGSVALHLKPKLAQRSAARPVQKATIDSDLLRYWEPRLRKLSRRQMQELLRQKRSEEDKKMVEAGREARRVRRERRHLG